MTGIIAASSLNALSDRTTTATQAMTADGPVRMSGRTPGKGATRSIIMSRTKLVRRP